MYSFPGLVRTVSLFLRDNTVDAQHVFTVFYCKESTQMSQNPTYNPYGPDDPTQPASGQGLFNAPVPPPPPPITPVVNPYDPYALTTPQRPPEQKKREKGGMVILAVAALLIIASGIIGFVAYTNNQNTIRNTNATATAQAQIASTAHTQAASTAQAVAASTAQAATAIASTYPFSDKVVLKDQLSDSSHVSQYGWNDDGTYCSCANGSYIATEKTENLSTACYAEKTNFANFTFQIQMTIQQGEAGGVIFRRYPDMAQYYAFVLSVQGKYALYIQNNANAANTQIIKEGTIPGFATGTLQLHTIGIVANGDQLSVYVDNFTTPVIPPTINSSFTSGQIGVLAFEGTNTTTAVVSFNAAEVWQLS